MKKIFWLLIALLASLYGCSSSSGYSTASVRNFAENKNWERTFTGFDLFLSSNNKKDYEDLVLISKDYPQILIYAQSKFSLKELNQAAIDINDLTYKKSELTRFCLIFTVQQCNDAVDNMAQADKLIRKEMHLTKDLYASLNEKEQKALTSNFKIIFYEHDEVGIITERQVRNLSTPGSNFGAEAGGAAGAVAYVNNVDPAKYSLGKDVSSTLLGAVIGAALFNKQAVEQYQIRYTLKLRNGDLKQFDFMSSTPLADGVGVCIGMPYGTKVDQALCTMTLAEFRVKYADELKI